MYKCLQVTNKVNKLATQIDLIPLLDKFTFTKAWLDFADSLTFQGEHDRLERDSSQQILILIPVICPIYIMPCPWLLQVPGGALHACIHTPQKHVKVLSTHPPPTLRARVFILRRLDMGEKPRK